MHGWTWNGVRILIIKKPSLFFIYPVWCGLIRINVDAGMNLKRLEIERKEGGPTGRDERQREKKRKKWGAVRRWWEAEKRKGVAAAECYFRFMIEKTSYLYLFFFLMLAWLNRFSSVQSVSDFGNRNWTKPELFCDFLIG